MAKTSKNEELMAYAIWHTPSVAVYDKAAIANSLATYLGVNDPEDFVRIASDPQYGPTGPALLEPDLLTDARMKNADKGDEPSNWDLTPEGSGPVVPPGHASRKKEGPTPDEATAAKKAEARS